MAYFDRAVPPGGEGKITLKLSTKGYQGTVTKGVTVYTNDPGNITVMLSVRAVVRSPIHLSSRYVYLYGIEGQTVTSPVEISGEPGKPLALVPAEFNLREKVIYVFKEVEKGKKFRIEFKSVPGPPQTYQGFLKLKTNYPEKPEITILIRGRFGKKG